MAALLMVLPGPVYGRGCRPLRASHVMRAAADVVDAEGTVEGRDG